ncbi:MAG: hypothetical protein GX447_03605 [Elusimicrobia bacterium]|nr:hypothetical protein [Elusimicrobiota bacterium]
MKKIILISLFLSLNFNLNAENNFKAEMTTSREILSDSSLDMPAFSMERVASFDRSPNIAPALDISLKLPFLEINKRLKEINPSLLRASSSLPILYKKGNSIFFENAVIKYGGVDVEPSIALRPYFIAKNKLAIKVEKVEADISFGPSKSFNQIDKNSLMEKAALGIMEAVIKAMDDALLKNKVGLKAKDLISYSYDRSSWTLYFNINPSFISPLMPGLVSSLNLNSFGFDEEGFYLKAGFNSELIPVNPSFNLAVSDGLLTAFVKKYSEGSDMDLAPVDYEGGFKFREDGSIELRAKAKVDSLPFNPNVYFKAFFRLSMPADNTVRVRIEKVEVDKVYGSGLLAGIANWFEKKITSSAVEEIVSNPQINKAVKAKKIDDKTIELNFSNAAFLPSFAKGAAIKAVSINKGLCYLSFEF